MGMGGRALPGRSVQGGIGAGAVSVWVDTGSGGREVEDGVGGSKLACKKDATVGGGCGQMRARADGWVVQGAARTPCPDVVVCMHRMRPGFMLLTGSDGVHNTRLRGGIRCPPW